MCKHCQGFWKQGRGATRLVQIIGRHRGRKISLQLIMDEPPEALYNQWIKDRIEYYKRVEPVAAPRDEQLDLGPPWQGSGSHIPMIVVPLDNSFGSPS